MKGIDRRSSERSLGISGTVVGRFVESVVSSGRTHEESCSHSKSLVRSAV